MRLLFLLDGVYAPGGPTVRFGAMLAAEAAAHGHEVAALQNVPVGEAQAIPAVELLAFNDTTEVELYCSVARWRAAGVGAVGMLFRALASPRVLVTAFRLLVLKRSPLEARFRRELHTLFARRQFDAVVSVSAPHYTAFALATSGVCTVKAAYMVDPYASAQTMRYISSASREKMLYRHLDIAFITDVMAEQRLYPTGFKAKTCPLHFPGIRRPQVQPCGDDVPLSGDAVNCVFVGNLYLDIRSPAFAIQLFAKLPPRFRLVLVGDGYAQFPQKMRDAWEKALGNRLVVVPPVSQKAAFNAMQRADVLVSVGNSDPSQLPSKVFDYVSTGRPVLNLCKLPNCPTLPFMQVYPLALSLFEDDGLGGEAVQKAAGFIEQNAGRQLPFEDVEPLFGDYTPAAVTEKMLDVIGGAVAAAAKGEG